MTKGSCPQRWPRSTDRTRRTYQGGVHDDAHPEATARPHSKPRLACACRAPLTLSLTNRRMGVTVTSASPRHEIPRVRSAKRSGQCPGFCTVCQRDASVSVVKKCPLWSLRPALPGGHTSKAWAGLSPTWPRPPVTGRAAQLGAPPPSTRQRRPPQGSCTSAQHP